MRFITQVGDGKGFYVEDNDRDHPWCTGCKTSKIRQKRFALRSFNRTSPPQDLVSENREREGAAFFPCASVSLVQAWLCLMPIHFSFFTFAILPLPIHLLMLQTFCVHPTTVASKLEPFCKYTLLQRCKYTRHLMSANMGLFNRMMLSAHFIHER